MATATFPSSRRATGWPHGTASESPSQVRGADRVRAVDPRFSHVVEELHGHEEPPRWSSDQFHELDATPVTADTLTDIVGFGEHVRHVPETEAEPRGTTLPDVSDSFWCDANGPHDARDSWRKAQASGHTPGDLHVIRVGADDRRAAHSAPPNSKCTNRAVASKARGAQLSVAVEAPAWRSGPWRF